jgi:hypothetical protein
MAGKIVRLMSFNPDDATDGVVESPMATQNEDAEALLAEILAMLDDARYTRKEPFLTSVYNWVSERGFCTPGQREAVENCRRHVEGH